MVNQLSYQSCWTQALLRGTRAAAEPTNDSCSEGSTFQMAKKGSLPTDPLWLLKLHPNRLIVKIVEPAACQKKLKKPNVWNYWGKSQVIYSYWGSQKREHLFRPEFADSTLLQASVLFQNAGDDVPNRERFRNSSKTKQPIFL